jgi:hypothetical protein
MAAVWKPLIAGSVIIGITLLPAFYYLIKHLTVIDPVGFANLSINTAVSVFMILITSILTTSIIIKLREEFRK